MKPTLFQIALSFLALIAGCVLAPTLAGAGPLNIPSPTLPGAPFWNDPEPIGDAGWNLQLNSVTGHWRLLDPGNIRRAWGTRAQCEAAYAKAIAEETEPKGEFNVPLPTLEGWQLWADLRVGYGWRMQRNPSTGHARVLDSWGVRRAWGTPEAMALYWDETVRPKLAEIEAERGKPEKIVLFLNGIVRSKASWFLSVGDIASRAESDGRAIEAWPVNYASTRVSIEESADFFGEVVAALPEDVPVVIVCHSMGGLVTNTWLGRRGRPASEAPQRVESIVYLGTPFAGSPRADALADLWVYKVAYGPAGSQLVAETPHLEDYPWPDCRTVCVAGSNPPDGFAGGLGGDNDGTVAVSSALPEQADERMKVKALHSFLMYVGAVREKIVEVVFDDAPEEPAPED